MTNIIGASPTLTHTAPQFGLGDQYEDQSGNVWVYVKASGSISQYDVVTYDETYSTVVAPVSTSNKARGDKLGVAAVAFSANDYGWLQVYGVVTMNVLGTSAANVELTVSATAGKLSSASTTGLVVADNAFITTASSASTTNAVAGVLNFSQCGRTL